MRKDKNSSAFIIHRLCAILLKSIRSMIYDYSFLYSVEELSLLRIMLEKISNSQDVDTINLVEKELKEFAFRTWEYEEKSESHFIHWLKSENLNTSNPTISTTFGDVEPFCNSVVGIRYKTNKDGFLGACEKDAGVVVEENSNQSIYTIKVLEDGRVVNSYNLGTPIMTPKMAMDTRNNDYKSRHNEILLDARIAVPIDVICIDKRYEDLAENVSQKYGIPYYQDECHKKL